MYPKANRLPRTLFHHVFDTGARLSSYEMTIISAPNTVGVHRFGIIVGKTVHKHAVVRNRIKRCIRNAVRSALSSSATSADIIFLVRKNISDKSQKEMTQLIKHRLTALHIIPPHEITHS